MCENRYFSVFLDSLESKGHDPVKDYLVVQPKNCIENSVYAVAILPVWAGKIGLLNIYRHPIEQDCWEIPGGFMEKGELALSAAKRELSEETGFDCSKEYFHDLGTVAPAPSIIAAQINLYAATECLPLQVERSAEMGHKEFNWFSKSKVMELVSTKKILDTCTLIALSRAENLF